MSRNHSVWTRLLVEGFVIVASILLALFLDTWWEDRQDAVEERQALTAIVAEFEENATEIDRLLRVHESHIEFLNGFFGADAGSLASQGGDTLGVKIAAAFSQVMTLDPATQTLEALESSGRMSLISDADVRTGLAAWSTFLEDSREEAAKMLGALDRSLELLHGLQALTPINGVPVGRLEPGAVVRARESDALSAHAAVLTFWRVQYVGELERLQAATELVLERIKGVGGS